MTETFCRLLSTECAPPHLHSRAAAVCLREIPRRAASSAVLGLALAYPRCGAQRAPQPGHPALVKCQKRLPAESTLLKTAGGDVCGITIFVFFSASAADA